jgi:glutathione synthase/RimK-type ligase-like ATP-grasp enzyme
MDDDPGPGLDAVLERARALVRAARDEDAKRTYLEVLHRDPANFCALNELGTLALAGGFRSAARTAYTQAVAQHPGNKVARVNLANVLREENDVAGARLHYQAALALDPDLHEAHQGMAWVLNELDLDGAEDHRRRGFTGRAIVTQPYRGTGSGVPLLLLVSARGGNIPTRLWIDDRRFTIHAIYTDYYDLTQPLPEHALIMNAVGDADLCALALKRAHELVAQSGAPVINRPERVRITGRAENARRLGAIPGLIAPKIRALPRAALLAAEPLAAEPFAAAPLEFPLLLRSPGFHTGRHFVYVESREQLPQAAASLKGDEVLAIQYLDARGDDGMARKYRVMFVDGVAYPLHLAVSADWKVHYFTAAMAASAAFREEERRFLNDMPGVLGARAMHALGKISAALGLEYAGIDFALARDGSVLLFEANATMVVFPPGPDPIWDYRRAAIDAVIAAAARMLDEYAARGVAAAGVAAPGAPGGLAAPAPAAPRG